MESEKFTQPENLQIFSPKKKERLTIVNKWFFVEIIQWAQIFQLVFFSYHVQ